jgi:hypothetical protein
MHVMEVRRGGDGLPKVRSRMRDRLDGPITESYRCRDADDRAGAEFIVRYLSQHDRRHRTGDSASSRVALALVKAAAIESRHGRISAARFRVGTMTESFIVGHWAGFFCVVFCCVLPLARGVVKSLIKWSYGKSLPVYAHDARRESLGAPTITS